MDKKIDLCLRPTEFFQQCVAEVMGRQKFATIKEAEFYVVDLLGRYLSVSNLFEKSDDSSPSEAEPLAIMLMKAQNPEVGPTDRIKLLKKLGDTSLYISGFFGDSLNRKIVDLDYYREMGCIAYRSLSETIREVTFQQVYRELHDKFSGFVDILTEISQTTMVQDNQSLLRLYEVYAKTGSELARKQLTDRGLPTSRPSVAAKKLV